METTQRNQGSISSNKSKSLNKDSMIEQEVTPAPNDKCTLVPVIDKINMANCFLDEPVANDYIRDKLAQHIAGKDRARYELFEICHDKQKHSKGFDSDRIFKFSE